MDSNEENLLRRYIFGQALAQKEEAGQELRDSEKNGLDSSFRDWKLIFWEQCFADGTCRLTQYAAKLFGVPENCENFPACLFGKGILSQQTERAFRRADYRLHAGEERFTFEAVVNSSADLPKWLEIECSLETDAEGLPVYAVGFAHDISSKKLLEQKYQDQIAYRNGLCANTLNCMRIDLTEDRITEYNTPVGEITEMCALFSTADACLRKITTDMLRRSDVDKYRDILTTQGLVDAYNRGQNNVVVEYYDTMLQKWLKISFVILKNPSNYHIDCFGICTDISETKLLEIALNNVTKQDYAILGIVDTIAKDYLYLKERSAGPIMNVYEDIEDFLHFAMEELGSTYAGLEAVLDPKKIGEALTEHKEYSIVFDNEGDGRRRQIYFAPTDEDEHLIMLAVRDITDDALLERLRYDAEHDALTGLYNRDKAFLVCNAMLKQYPEEVFIVAHFDIQKFRLYNSFFGEKEGDRLLQYIAATIRELCATFPYSVFGRIEADVFFICIPYDDTVVERVHDVVHERLQSYRSDFQITGNCGIYLAKDRRLSAQAMFTRAAIVAKDNSKKQLNPVKIFEDREEARLNREHEIALDMHRALVEKQFVVYLQPKYKLMTGEPFGAEALVRWMHPQKGLIMPGDFIPLFESNGFIIELDRYMWEQVCLLLKKWLDAGEKPCPISVNMSRVSMYSNRTVGFLRKLVEKYAIPPELLNLELTESAYMDAPEEMKQRLNELRQAGFRLMMDDFGSGYSSLNLLREIPVDYLKVDRVFLASVDNDERSRLVLASVVHMASRMGIPVVTEGVETETQRAFLCSIGCDYIQGFLYAKPMPVADYEKRILADKECYTVRKSYEDTRRFLDAMNVSTSVQEYANLLPYATAILEFVGTSFTFLSANDVFLKEFGIYNNVQEREKHIARHISKEDYEDMLKACQCTTETGETQTTLFYWHRDDGLKQRYVFKVAYLGKNDYATILSCTYMDVTDVAKKLCETDGEASK